MLEANTVTFHYIDLITLVTLQKWIINTKYQFTHKTYYRLIYPAE